MDGGTPSRAIAALTAWTASLSAAPGARLKEIVVATVNPWWLTASGTLPAPMWVTALSGIIVSVLVLTAEPVEAVPWPVLPIELSAWLRTASAATAAAAADEFDVEAAAHVVVVGVTVAADGAVAAGVVVDVVEDVVPVVDEGADEPAGANEIWGAD
jgi:hypothetical protein